MTVPAICHQSDKPADLFWIDALCINQNDVDEKNRQTSQMSEINRTAKETLAWLGPEGDDSAIAAEFITDLCCHLRSLDTSVLLDTFIFIEDQPGLFGCTSRGGARC